MTSTSSARPCSTHRPAGARHDRRDVPSSASVAGALAAFDAALASPLAVDLVGPAAALFSPLEPAARLTSETMRHLPDVKRVLDGLYATATPSTSAVLHLAQHLARDARIRRRARDELARRTTPVPDWVARFGELHVVTPVKLVADPLRATETLVVGAELAGIDLATVHATLTGLGLDPAEIDEIAQLSQQAPDPMLPPLPVFDAFTMVVTVDVGTDRRIPLEVLLTQHRAAGLAEQLCVMDGPRSTIRDISTAEAHAMLAHVLAGTDQVVALDEGSAATLPLLRCVSERLAP